MNLLAAATEVLVIGRAGRHEDCVRSSAREVLDLLELVVSVRLEGDAEDVDERAVDQHAQLEEGHVGLVGLPYVHAQ